MQIRLRDASLVVLLCLIGLVSVATAVAHALYLGFDLSYFIPLASVSSLAVMGVWASWNKFSAALNPLRTKQLLLLTLLGAVTRGVMLFNPNASGDESYIAYLSSRMNPFDLAHFTQNFQQITGPFATVTTPLPFVLTRIGWLVWPSIQGARLIPIGLDVLLTPVAYFLAREFTDERVSKMVALLVALNPASVYFLGAAETDIYLFFFCMVGLLLFVRGYTGGSIKVLVMSVALFGLAYWSKPALADVWMVAVVIVAVLKVGDGQRLKKVATVGIVVVASIGVFLPWSVANPTSFHQEFVGIPVSVVQTLLNPGSILFGGSGTPITITSIHTVTSSTSSTTEVSSRMSTSTSTTSTQTSMTSSTTKTSLTAHSSTITSTAVSTLYSSTVTTIGISSTTPGSNTGGLGSFFSSLLGGLTLTWILPTMNNGSGLYTSVIDVYANVVLWFGPLTILIGMLLAAYYLLKGPKRGFHFALVVWIVLIAIALLSLNRDVRYFVDVASFPVILLAAEVVDLGNLRMSRYLTLMLIVFAVVFMVLGMTVGYQLTNGIAQASEFTNANFSSATVGLNDNGFRFFLNPNDTVTDLPVGANQLNSTLSSTHYDAVLIWSQTRTFTISGSYEAVLDSHFAHKAEFGTSGFSFVTVYYN